MKQHEWVRLIIDLQYIMHPKQIVDVLKKLELEVSDVSEALKVVGFLRDEDIKFIYDQFPRQPLYSWWIRDLPLSALESLAFDSTNREPISIFCSDERVYEYELKRQRYKAVVFCVTPYLYRDGDHAILVRVIRFLA